MTDFTGRFVWYELMTTDPKAAEGFYAAVVGWTARDAGMAGMDYTLLQVGEAMVAGLMALPDSVRDMGVPPNWSGYVAVPDVDAAAEKVASLGGVIHRPPDDIPEVGRFAVAADPQGAAFILFAPTPASPPVEPAPGAPGTIGWHELYASDWPSAFAFYAELFGWVKDQAVAMGEAGTYQLFAPRGGGAAIGGMFDKPAEVPACFWLYYFVVDEIDAAVERVKAQGGKVLLGPMAVPGGSFIVQCQDPQGAMFALTGPRA